MFISLFFMIILMTVYLFWENLYKANFIVAIDKFETRIIPVFTRQIKFLQCSICNYTIIEVALRVHWKWEMSKINYISWIKTHSNPLRIHKSVIREKVLYHVSNLREYGRLKRLESQTSEFNGNSIRKSKKK